MTKQRTPAQRRFLTLVEQSQDHSLARGASTPQGCPGIGKRSTDLAVCKVCPVSHFCVVYRDRDQWLEVQP